MAKRNQTGHPQNLCCARTLALSLTVALLGVPAVASSAEERVARSKESATAREAPSRASRAPDTAARTSTGSRGSSVARSGHRDPGRDRLARIAKDRSRARSDRNSGGYRGGHHYGSHYGSYYPYFSYYGRSFSIGYWGLPYFYYWPGSLSYTRIFPNRRYGASGALDINIRPKKTEIYVDGQYIGVAGRYDGFPSYLWLEEGTYDVVFYRQGYETLARQYTIYPGLTVDVNDRLVPGQAIRPEDLPSRSTTRRDDRLRRDRQRRETAYSNRRDRFEERSRQGELERRSEVDSFDARSAPARVRLDVRPQDATVYLDSRFLGSGTELSSLHAGLIVDAGDHVLEVVHPGYETSVTRFAVESSEEIELEVELKSER